MVMVMMVMIKMLMMMMMVMMLMMMMMMLLLLLLMLMIMLMIILMIMLMIMLMMPGYALFTPVCAKQHMPPIFSLPPSVLPPPSPYQGCLAFTSSALTLCWSPSLRCWKCSPATGPPTCTLP